jgi:5-methylcytosine-specific restriction endonuclease McrA
VSATVRLSLKAARALYSHCMENGRQPSRALGELQVALAKASRASATRRTLRKPKAAKQKSKREARAEVRAAVIERARGKCEACGAWSGQLQLDHFFGRARSESPETCWALDGNCHKLKTNNRPSAQRWLTIFADHCLLLGYAEAEARARKRLAFVEARGAP